MRGNRRFWILALVPLWTPVQAQGLAGPLDVPHDPSAPVVAKPAPAKHAKAKPKAPRAATPTALRAPPQAPAADRPDRQAASAPATSPSGAPVTFGMKWSGTNESGRETRFENLNGGYAGTGGAVGLKLPF